MPLTIIVCVKQVVDPETPATSLRLDRERRRVSSPANVPPVVNGFDENAVEAALKLKDTQGARVVVISGGASFAMDVIKKPLSMGCDELVLIQDPGFEELDSYGVAQALAAAIKKVGQFDLILCGRQASDWDNAQVPLGIAELLGLPSITIAKKVDVTDSRLIVEKVMPDGYEVWEANLPAVVTVSNELGQPRYPSLRNIMAAVRKTPTIWSLKDLGVSLSGPQIKMTDLFVPVTEKECQFIEGQDDADAGRKLALTLREAKLI